MPFSYMLKFGVDASGCRFRVLAQEELKPDLEIWISRIRKARRHPIGDLLKNNSLMKDGILVRRKTTKLTRTSVFSRVPYKKRSRVY